MPKGPIGPGLSKKRVLAIVGEMFYSKTAIDAKQNALTEAIDAKANADAVAKALNTKANADAVAKALNTKANADSVMPKSGGSFTGTAYAQSANTSATALRNGLVQNSGGGTVSTNFIIYRRK